MDELAGKNGSLENRSVELIGLLNDLQVLMKDNALFPRVKQSFERKCENLKNMDLIMNKIRDHIVAMTAKDSERQVIEVYYRTVYRKRYTGVFCQPTKNKMLLEL